MGQTNNNNVHELVAHGSGNGADKEKELHIFVNRLKFDRSQGVMNVMTAGEIAGLVGLTAETAIVRRIFGQSTNHSEPLSGSIEIKNGDQFAVTRKQVEGGFSDRVTSEIERLKESGQVAEVIGSYVLYHALPVFFDVAKATDVLVEVPNGYPASMIDRAAVPADSPLIGRVKGSPQEVIEVGGRSWRMISYHPHNGGGGPVWNPNKHGFHTYLQEVIRGLEGANEKVQNPCLRTALAGNGSSHCQSLP